MDIRQMIRDSAIKEAVEEALAVDRARIAREVRAEFDKHPYWYFRTEALTSLLRVVEGK